MELNGTIFLQVLIFLTLLLWLSRSLFAPILRLFDERERRIVGAKEAALELSARALEKSQSFDIEYEKAKSTARHALNELKQDMEKEHSEILNEAKALARETLRKAEADLEKQEEEIRPQLLAASMALADDIVGTLLKKKSNQVECHEYA